MAAHLTDEGRIEVERGYTIAYRTYGEGSRTLLGLHGGPGTSSHYLDRLAETVGGDRRLVLYDQLGGGDSDQPDDPSLWQIPRFITEVETVRTALDLGVVTLYGQSWGGMLALAYTLDHRENVDALVLSNTYANGKDYLLDISEHRMALGKDVHALMLRHEHADDLDAPDYLDAVLELNSRHLRRSSPYDPETSRREYAEIEAQHFPESGPAYALWGPHEFRGTGPQAFFDISGRLGEIRVPALILCGWYDELSPKRCSRTLADGIADNEFVVFGNASHLTILEKEAELYLACIRDFLARRVPA
ncbi:MAG TPA: proline iminopeptidase-family hydrolase [Gaiellales bacterium]|nr:proline iminopeptidase-family hydrolase [Gaiellales bacterium]